MLKPGDSAPPFDLPCAVGDRIDRLPLRQISTEMVVLFFYPRDFSFICPTEVVGFDKALKFFTDENTTLLGASVDDAESHVRWARELGGIGLATTDLVNARSLLEKKEKALKLIETRPADQPLADADQRIDRRDGAFGRGPPSRRDSAGGRQDF